MRFLCLCHALTPALAPLLEHLASNPQNQLLIAQVRQKKDISIANARHVKLKRPEIKKAPRNLPECWQIAAQIGKCALQSLEVIAQSGFSPDVVLLATLSGSSLGIREVFPDAFQVAYLENLEAENEAVRRYRKQMIAIQIMESDLVYDLGGAIQDGNEVKTGPLCVNPVLFRPLEFSDIGYSSKLPEIVFSQLGLSKTETDKWLEIIKIFSQAHSRTVHVLAPDMAGLRKVSGLGLPGLSCSCHLSNSQAAGLFGHARLLVWPGEEITPELLQAMSCGVAIAAPRIDGLLEPGINCVPLPEKNLPEKLLELLRDPELLVRMGSAARKTVLENFSQEKVIPSHIAEILSAMAAKDTGQGMS